MRVMMLKGPMTKKKTKKKLELNVRGTFVAKT